MLSLNGACFLKEWFSTLKGHDWLVRSVTLWFLPSVVVIGQLNDLFKTRSLPFCRQAILVFGRLNAIHHKNGQTARENRWFKYVSNFYKCNLCKKSEYHNNNLRIKQPFLSFPSQNCHLWGNWQNIKMQTQDSPFIHTVLFQCRAWLVVSSC